MIGRDADRAQLAARVRSESEMWALVRSKTTELIASARPREDAYADVSVFETACARAILADGSADAASFAPLVARAVAQVTVLDASGHADVNPQLAVLNVLGDLQAMGLAVPPATVATARDWLAGMHTENIEPEYWHWQRGWAALALGDLRTARTIAAVPESGPTGIDSAAYPEFNIQAWYAFLLAAVLGEIDWPVLAMRWAEFLLLIPTFEQTRVCTLRDVPWIARVVHSVVADHPVATVADWLRTEFHRVAGMTH